LSKDQEWEREVFVDGLPSFRMLSRVEKRIEEEVLVSERRKRRRRSFGV